jgi:anti-sigma-K factor RskA
MNCDEVEELIGAYALRALPSEALSDIGEHLAGCGNHPEAADLRAIASALAFAAPEAEPSPALKTRLMNAIGAETATPPEARRRGGLLDRLRGLMSRRAIPYALAGALAIAVAALVLTNVGGSDEPGATAITLTGPGGASAVVHVLEDGIVVMEADGLEPLERDQTYQVWAIEGGQPASLGLLGPAPDGEALGATRADLSGVEALAVTAEPAGGSIGPTTDPVLLAENLTLP